MDFIIQKLKNKHIFLKKLSNWAKLNSLILREREETITKYFAPKLYAEVHLKGLIFTKMNDAYTLHGYYSYKIMVMDLDN